MGAALWFPSYGQNFARNAAEAAYPGLRDELGGLWFPSLGVTGNTLHDLSPYRADGTFSAVWSPTWAMEGDIGPSIYCDWAAGYIDCGIPGPQHEISAGSFTAMAWIRPLAVDQKGWGLITTNVTNGYCLGQVAYGAGDWAMEIWLAGVRRFATFASGSPVANQWACIVGEVDRQAATDTLRIYVNGVLGSVTDDISAEAGAIPNEGSLRLGGGWVNHDGNHYLGPVAIWHRLLSASERRLLYDDPLALVRPQRRVYAKAPAGLPAIIHDDLLYGSNLGSNLLLGSQL